MSEMIKEREGGGRKREGKEGMDRLKTNEEFLRMSILGE